MKDTLTDANFPRTADQRVYHLGVRPGEVANRIVTVGSPSRANTVASFLDAKPKPFVLNSERGFLTITGRYKGVPVSIISIGMGSPNMDFFVREIRESVSGDLAIIRLGSCGGLVDIRPGTVVVADACVSISRNVDFDFANPESCDEPAYRISKPVAADEKLTNELVKALHAAKPSTSLSDIISGTVNASADRYVDKTSCSHQKFSDDGPVFASFYSSQGRQTSFPDHNEHLIEYLQKMVENLSTLEMETFHLFHLAACWRARSAVSTVERTPLTTGPVTPVIAQSSNPTPQIPPTPQALPNSVIRAAGIHMVFASRKSRDFITPEQVKEVEEWTGQGVLNALVNIDIPEDQMHTSEGSVWELV
ncbi:Purine nucleoside phosphorylase DeoD-type [Psilocybe cubensis]|uniref:Nucleoside phosphorylase domain-containing protein n=2 Tax=Psilocybe cubensis TaxID=181762 RepID=A0A8H7XT17_PSICU|nr:Purine nucleoside phosphorylase DeoD-type [Psilocybe cubensis]KAH9475776.1 Purine nucleoside phosphorylase DeoD-type [Psilocybe cubensis]